MLTIHVERGDEFEGVSDGEDELAAELAVNPSPGAAVTLLHRGATISTGVGLLGAGLP